MHIYGIQKNGTEEFIYRTAMEKQPQRTDLWTGERGGEGEMCGESNRETYITIQKGESQQEFALCLKKLIEGLVYQPSGVRGEGDGRKVQKGGDRCLSMADSR